MAICCFTGLRPHKLNFEYDNDVYYAVMRKCNDYIIQLIKKHNVNYFISGMALGWDTWCAEEVIKLKKVYDIILECAIPCEGQDKFWSKEDRIRYREILNHADIVNVLQQNYSRDCMYKRNCYMVDKSNYIFALWDGQSGGTSCTIKYAQKVKRQIVIINPKDF